ncbi:MAG: tetratricopeptide repeat protein [Anaerolineales bacterium]
MPDLTTVSQQLQSTFGDDAASQIARRLARVPAAWTALQHSDLLERALALDESELTPGSLGRLALDCQFDPEEPSTERIQALQSIAQRAVEWSAQIAEAESPDDLTDTIEADPIGMQPAVTCALSQTADRDVLEVLLTSGSSSVRAVGINALLASAPPAQAAVMLLDLPSSQTSRLLADLLRNGEMETATCLAEGMLPGQGEGAHGMPATSDPLLASLTHQALGNHAEAQAEVERAWEAATANMAAVADQLAEIASESGDPILATEARHRALDTLPTARRRAEACLTLLQAGDPDGAVRLLATPAQSSEEAIAAASAHLALAQTDEAETALEQATSAGALLDASWFERLVDSWLALGKTDQAITTLQAGIEQRPANLALRAKMATLSLAAANPVDALEQANLLHTVEGTTDHTRLLADSLQSNGQHQQALPYWLTLAEGDVSILPQVVDSALAAGETGTALKFAQQMVEADPKSAAGRIAMGKSLIAAGNHGAGQSHLQTAVEMAPGQPSVWLALAASQAESGEPNAVGDTLSAAVQSCPHSAEIQAQLAGWLYNQERWTDALAAIKRARELDPQAVDYMSRHGLILHKLGLHENCQKVLEETVSIHPSDWMARFTLASSYNQTNALERGLELLTDLPAEAPAAAHALRAEMTLTVAGTQANPTIGQQALDMLEHAQASGYRSYEMSYWFGRAYQSADRPADAIQAYQACLKSLPEAASELRQACLRGEAEAAIASDQIPLAISVLERARESGEIAPKTMSLLSHAYMQAGLTDEAFGPALTACEGDPDDPEIQTQFIDVAISAGKQVIALEKVEAWIDANARPDLLLSEADLLHQLGQPSEARHAIGQAIGLNRHDVDNLQAAAMRLMQHGEAPSAARILTAAERLRPNDPELLRQQANAADLAGDFERTRQAWAKLLDVAPDSIEALVGAAQAHWKTDQRSAAIGFLQRAVNLAPDRPDLQAGLARLQLANGETVQALNHFRTAVELSPGDQSLSLEVAQAFLDHGAPSEALDVLGSSEADVLRPERATTLAEAYLELGRPTDASVVLRRLSNPAESIVAASQLALAEAAQDNPEAAQEWFDRACAQFAHSTREAGWLARAALRLGQWKQAVNAFSAIDADDWSTETQLSAWMVATRVADAYWLFAECGKVVSHAPDATVVDVEQGTACAKWIDSLAAASSLAPSTIAAMQARTAMTFDPAPTAVGLDRNALPNTGRLRLHAAEGLAIAQLRAGDPEGALRTLAEARDAVHAGRWGAVIAGMAHTQMDKFSMARKAFGAVAKEPLLRPLAAYLAGETWAQEGRVSEAINNINTAILSWSDEPRWQRRLAELYLSDGRPEAALPHLQQSLELEPEHAAARLNLARALRAAGQISEAHEAFNKALPHHGGNAGILVEAAEVDLAAGHPKLAGDRFRQALDHQPKNAAARVGAARAALALGDQRAAEKHAAAALRANPTEPNVLLALGDVLAEQGKSEQALAMYDDARAHGNSPLNVERARGQLLLKMGRPDEAIQSLSSIVQNDPDDDVAWAALAESYAAANEPGQAIDAIRMALDIRPDTNSYRLHLARYFRATGQLDQSLAELTDLQTNSPGDHQVAFEMGCVHQARRQFEKALGAFERAISLRADSASAHYQAGLVLKTLKAYSRAAEMFQRAVDLNPQDSEALHQLAAVQALALVHGRVNATAVTL